MWMCLIHLMLLAQSTIAELLFLRISRPKLLRAEQHASSLLREQTRRTAAAVAVAV